jgi:SAM-dependent methyltransferase
LNLSPEKQRIWFAQKQSQWDRFWRRLGYSSPPDLTGKRLLDVGSGLGGNTAAAAKAGAKVVALEPDEEVHKVSISLVTKELGESSHGVEFVNSSVENYIDSEGFDYILCDELFEHLLEFSLALSAMSKLLRPGGKLVSGWGPLWHSPVGGHQLMLYAIPTGPFGLARKLTLKSLSVGQSGRQIVPFSHRIFTKRALRLNGETADDASIQRVGMNGLEPREFRELVESSPLQIESWHENQGDHTAYKILRFLSSLPGGKKLFTSNVYGVFSLPDARHL